MSLEDFSAAEKRVLQGLKDKFNPPTDPDPSGLATNPGPEVLLAKLLRDGDLDVPPRSKEVAPPPSQQVRRAGHPPPGSHRPGE